MRDQGGQGGHAVADRGPGRGEVHHERRAGDPDEAPGEPPEGGRLASRLRAALDQIELIGLDPSIDILVDDIAVVPMNGKDLCWYGARSVEGIPRLRALVAGMR